MGDTRQYVTSTTTTSNLDESSRPFYQDLMNRAQAQSYQPYIPYGYTQDKDGNVVRATDASGNPVDATRIAGFTPAQEQVQQNILGMTAPNQFGTGSALAYEAGLGALNQRYDTGQFNAQQVQGPQLNQYEMGPVSGISAQQYNAPTMQTARTNYRPDLTAFQMAAPEEFGAAQAKEYMSPYIQNVMDVQKREAMRDAQKSQLAEDLGSARQGTYGGSRQLLASLERERNLGTQLGDIQARGQQAAYENAQAQFERDRAAGLTAGQQNLQARLATQELGAQQGMQAALANLSSEQQANVQNQAAQLQTQGLNAEQAMRAALANQGVDVTRAQANLQSQLQTQELGSQNYMQASLANQQQDLEAQRLREQSRQFGSQQGLAGLQLAGDMGQTLGNLGQYQQTADLQRLQAQSDTARQQQMLQQQYYDQRYADYLRQRDYPMEQLGQYSNLIRGLPVGLSSTNITYAQPPSLMSQVAGAGLGAYSTAQMLKGP